MRRRVAAWPKYLLKNIPADDRLRLSEQAADQDISVSDIVRRLLCSRYRLDCPPESYNYQSERDAGSATILLRLQPKLAAALEREVGRTGYSKRRIILEAIHNRKGEL